MLKRCINMKTIKIDGHKVEYADKIKVNSLTEIPRDFMNKYYFNNANYKFYVSENIIYAIPTTAIYFNIYD